MRQPYLNDAFNVNIEYGANVTLTCRDEYIEPEYDVLFWVLPDTTVLTNGQRVRFNTLDGMSGWSVDYNGMNLYIHLLVERQFGFYYCVVLKSNRRYVIKKAVNYKGSHFPHAWEKYRRNVTVGAIACGVLLIMSALFLLSSALCSRNEKKAAANNMKQQETEKRLSFYESVEGTACNDNPAFELHDVQIECASSHTGRVTSGSDVSNIEKETDGNIANVSSYTNDIKTSDTAL